MDHEPHAAPLEAEPEEGVARPHSPGYRVVALLLTLALIGITIMGTGYSLFRAPPTPERTRPLPELIPEQGAVR